MSADSRRYSTDALLGVWRRVLEVNEIGVDDNFFSLGGDSLKAMELMVAVEVEFSILVDPVTIVEHPNFGQFAAAMERAIQVDSADHTESLQSRT